MAMSGKLANDHGLIGTFFQTLEQELVAEGGRVEMLDNLSKKHLRLAIKKFAIEIIRLSEFNLRGWYSSHAAAINIGGYDLLSGLASKPSQIKPAIFQKVDCAAYLESDQKSLSVQEAFNLYFLDDSGANLFDLEVFGVDYPDIQLCFKIAVVWKTDGQFWRGILSNENGIHRVMDINTADPNAKLGPDICYLTRKP
jgi:hypothetical protein